MPFETQLRADVDALRQQGFETQDLYREVCAILFFRYGITPTANKLYQYVRKGSMSVPAEALAKFWDELREKSRVRIEHPDLPEAIKLAAGELVATLWNQAQAGAQDQLGAFRAEAQATVRTMQAEKEIAEDLHNNLQKEVDQLRHAAQVAADRILELERQGAGDRAGKEALSVQLEAASHQRTSLETALTEARRDFTAELQSLRHALQRSEERLEASEKRALLEIDRERTAAVRIQKEATQLRQSLRETADRHQTEVQILQQALGEAGQKLGMGEGTLQELRAAHQQQSEHIQLLRKMLGERDTEKALLQRDLDASQSRVAELAAELRQREENVKKRKPRERRNAPAKNHC